MVGERTKMVGERTLCSFSFCFIDGCGTTVSVRHGNSPAYTSFSKGCSCTISMVHDPISFIYRHREVSLIQGFLVTRDDDVQAQNS